MEVIEHIRDRESDLDVATHSASGALFALSESRRVLKTGGKLFITTPNVCNYRCILNLLADRHPYSYLPHFREYSWHDLSLMIAQFPFKILRYQQETVWRHHGLSPAKIRQIARICKAFRKNPIRGDNHFILLEAI